MVLNIVEQVQSNKTTLGLLAGTTWPSWADISALYYFGHQFHGWV
jgi:uncharacterized protein YdiU (UPF0061 family)